MDQDRLDKFMKNQVEQHQTPTDPDLLWQKIQAKQVVEKKPKRRFFFFWLFGGVCLFGGLLFLYTVQFSNSENQQADDRRSTQEQQVETEYLSQKPTASKLQENKNLKAKEESNVTPNNTLFPNSSTNKEEKTIVPSTKPTTEKSLNSNRAITPENGTHFAHTTPINTKDNLSTTTQKKNASTTIELNKTTAKVVSPALESEALPQGENTIPAFSETSDAKVKVEALSAQEEITETPSNTIPNTSQTSPTQAPITKAENNPALAKPAIDSASMEVPKEKIDTLVAQKQLQSKKRKWHFSTLAGFTYGQALRTLANQNSTPTPYLQTREELETSLDAVRANLDFMLQHQSGFYLKTGLEYEQINERFEAYIEWDSTKVENNQLLAIAYDRDGIPSERRGNGEVETTYWAQKKIYNHYRSIEVPLVVGYHSKKKDQRLAWFAEAGASMNLWFGANGEILDPDGQPIRLEDQSALFKTQTGISLLGAIGVSYQVAEKYSIWASPSIKHQLGSIAGTANTLDQKYTNLGFRVGIQYLWSK